MKKTFLLILIFACAINVSGRGRVTCHFGEKPDSGGRIYEVNGIALSYKGIPIKASASVWFPFGKSEDTYLTRLFIVFERPEDSQHDLSLTGICTAYQTEHFNRDVNLKQIEVEKRLNWYYPNGIRDSEKVSEYVKPGLDVVANIKVKLNWENPDKSTLRIKLKEAIFLEGPKREK